PYSARHLSIVYCGRGDKKEQKWDQYNGLDERLFISPGESILLNRDMYNIQVATGSACTSRTLEPSHVLLAVGLKHEEAHGSMVMTLGRSNNAEEIPIITKAVKETVQRLRILTPM
ncbi:MAG: hypothetical protein ACXQTY_04270, partial [Candidatus Methanogasteraceae archaeon]